MKPNSLFRVLFYLAALAGLASAAKPVTIWVSSDADLKYYQSMVGLYRQKVDKDFQANVQAFGITEMPDKLSLAVKSGINTPDIVQFEEIFFSLYLKGEVPFVDLTDRIAASPLGRGILPQRMGLFTWKGRIYGVPQSLSSVVLWYRADLFKNLGIAPRDLSTWDKFESVGRSLKHKHILLTAMDWSYLDILLRQRGYDLFNADGKIFPDSVVAVQTWRRLASWIKDSVAFIPDRGGIFESSFFSNYVNSSSVASLIGPDWYGLDLIQNYDTAHAGKWRAMPLPVWTDSLSHGRRNTSSFSGQGLVIFKKSPQVDRSWKFVEWVMSDPDANVQRYLQGNSFTAYRPAWTDLRLSRPNAYFGNQDLAQLFTEIAPSMPYTVQSPLHALVINLVREEYFLGVMQGQSTPEKTIDAIRAEVAQMTSHPAEKALSEKRTENLMPRRARPLPFLLLAPFFTALFIFWFIPLLRGFHLSLQSDDLYGSTSFVGFAHYRDLLHDERFWHALRNTFAYCVLSVLLILPLALGLAHLLRRAYARSRTLIQFCLMLPGLTPPLVMALLYVLIFSGSHGLLNRTFLHPFGLPDVDWIRDPRFIKPSLALLAVWRWTGFITLIFLSGLEGIPRSYYDSASTEGASAWQMLRHITLPLLRPVTAFVAAFLFLDAFTLFEGAYVLLGGSGGVMDAGLLLISYSYLTAFTLGSFGSAVAIAFSSLPLLMVALWLILMQGRVRLLSPAGRSAAKRLPV